MIQNIIGILPTAIFLVLPNQCLQNSCQMPYIPEQHISAVEEYILKKPIRYVMGGNGPHVYDCGGILTEAYRKTLGYKGDKISSNTRVCIKPNKNAQPGDVLINTNVGERHVALITSYVSKNAVTILDYVDTPINSSYRRHTLYNGIIVLDQSCLLSL